MVSHECGNRLKDVDYTRIYSSYLLGHRERVVVYDPIFTIILATESMNQKVSDLYSRLGKANKTLINIAALTTSWAVMCWLGYKVKEIEIRDLPPPPVIGALEQLPQSRIDVINKDVDHYLSLLNKSIANE